MLNPDPASDTLWYERGDPSFMARGNCRDADTNLFFPKQGGSLGSALEYCNSCPVVDECLKYALDNAIFDGVWGGKSGRERRKMRGKYVRGLAKHGTPQRYWSGCRCDSCRAGHRAYEKERASAQRGRFYAHVPKHGTADLWDRCNCGACRQARPCSCTQNDPCSDHAGAAA